MPGSELALLHNEFLTRDTRDNAMAFRHGISREVGLVLALVAGALLVLGLVVWGGSEARDAQAALADEARAIAADRALLELRLASIVADPSSPQRGAVALDEARRLLAHDASALALLERVQSLAAQPANVGADTLAAWSALRELLAASASEAVGTARRESRRSFRLTVASGVVLTALTIGTMLLVRAEMRRRRRLAQSLEREANHDPLTMLPNRRFFLEWLGYALAQAHRDGVEMALLYIDLDGFKVVNDRHGHRRGDAVLAAIAERFRAVKREGDLLARLGGDEFALAAPRARDGRELAALGERLLAALSDPQQPKLADVHIGASIGIAFFPDDANDVPGLIAAADAAMYAAKRLGRNRVAFYATANAG